MMVEVFDKLISTEEGAGQEEFQISSDIDEIENPNQEGVINQISQNLCCQGFRSVKNNIKCKNRILSHGFMHGTSLHKKRK